jgi:polysaccharide biosynthesis transport protein
LLAFVGSLTRLSAPEEAPSETDRENSALRKFNPQRTVSRLGLTYVIDIGFTSHNPAKSLSQKIVALALVA